MNGEQELEQLIGRELCQLPDPQAPQTMMPLVLQKIQALQAAPWYRRPWFEWPKHWQLISAVTTVLIISALELFLRQNGLQNEIRREIADIITRLELRVHTLLSFWQLLIRPCAIYLLLLSSTALMLCLALINSAINITTHSREVRLS